MLKPFPGRGIALSGLFGLSRAGVLEHLVIIVLGPPDIHVKGQASRKTGSRFEFLYQVQIVLVLEQALRQPFDRFTKSETKRCAIESHTLSPGFVKQRRDAAEIDILDIQKSRAKTAVQCKFCS